MIIENDSSGLIECNTIVNPDITYSSTSGIDVSLSTGATYSCNQLDSNQIGMHFRGNCGLSHLYANTMQNNFWGLEIDTTSLIGVQTNNGNRWLNYRDSVGAINWDTSITVQLASEFQVGAGLGVYWPTIPSWNGGWFTPNPGTEKTCGNACKVEEVIDTTRDRSFEMSIADGSFESGSTSEENVVLAQQYLFDLLAQDSTLLHSDVSYEDFYDNQSLGAVGKINEVTQQIKFAVQRDSAFTMNVSQTDSLLQEQIIIVQGLDSSAIENPLIDYSTQKQTAIDQITDLRNDLEMLSDDQQIVSQSYLDSATIINNSIVPNELPQENEIFINQMNFIFLSLGEDSLYNYYDQLLAVAIQCPLIGGNAVFRARTMIGIFNDSISYENACAQNSSSRAMLASNNKKSNPQVYLIPNPADKKVTIQVKEKYNGICKIEISNAIGEIVIKEIKSCKEKSIDIDTRILSPGVYSVKVILNEISSSVVKLIIAR